MVSFHDKTGCSDLRADPGNNCTSTWKQLMEPYSSAVILSNISLLSLVCVIVSWILIDAVYTLWKRNKALGIRAFKGPGLRIRTLLSGTLCLIFYVVFYSLDANLAHDNTSLEGFVCITAGAFGNAFLFQTAGYVSVLYISTTSSILQKQTYLEKIDVRVLKRFAAPWILHLANTVTLLLLGFKQLSRLEQMDVVRILLGSTLTVLIPTSIIGFYYLNKLSKMLRDAERVCVNSQVKKRYRHLGIESKLMAYYYLIVGTIAAVLCVLGISTEILDSPGTNLLILALIGYSVCLYFVFFVLLFKRGSLRFTRTRSSDKVSDPRVDLASSNYSYMNPSYSNKTRLESSI